MNLYLLNIHPTSVLFPKFKSKYSKEKHQDTGSYICVDTFVCKVRKEF